MQPEDRLCRSRGGVDQRITKPRTATTPVVRIPLRLGGRAASDRRAPLRLPHCDSGGRRASSNRESRVRSTWCLSRACNGSNRVALLLFVQGRSAGVWPWCASSPDRRPRPSRGASGPARPAPSQTILNSKAELARRGSRPPPNPPLRGQHPRQGSDRGRFRQPSAHQGRRSG
jgi:hypothetical protein